MPIPSPIKKTVERLANAGLPDPIIYDQIQRQNSPLPGGARFNSVIDEQRIRNLTRKIHLDQERRDDDDWASVKARLEELHRQEDGFAIWLPQDRESSSCFGWVSDWQRFYLLHARCLSLDATHGVTMYGGGILYTLVGPEPRTHRGVPMAFMFTTDKSASPLADWLRFVKSTAGDLPLSRNLSHDCAELKSPCNLQTKISGRRGFV